MGHAKVHESEYASADRSKWFCHQGHHMTQVRRADGHEFQYLEILVCRQCRFRRQIQTGSVQLSVFLGEDAEPPKRSYGGRGGPGEKRGAQQRRRPSGANRRGPRS